MAKSAAVKKAWRSLTWLLVIIIGLTGLLAYGVVFRDATWTPKLGLDLEGGTEVILQPVLATGENPSSDQLTQAADVIKQRVDAGGLSEAQVQVQGGRNIIVTIAGSLSEQMRNLISSSAKLEFRSVLYTSAATNSMAFQAASTGNSALATASPSVSPTADTDIAVGSASPSNPSDVNWVDADLKKLYDSYDCSASTSETAADPDKPLVICDSDGLYKFLLGPVDRLGGASDGTLLDGEALTDATAGLQVENGVTTSNWAVNLSFNSDGSTIFQDVTSRIATLADPQNRFAIVLDNKVIESPSVSTAITGGKAEISGSFTQDTAKTLANQLKYGSLPMSFSVQSESTISPTLGSDQLVAGLVAGLIGLILVVGYSVVQYRALGSLTIASLAIAALVTYLLITLLSWRQGVRLSLASIAGLIVAIGITADSFIVYFERIRDELREGRSLVLSVETGWKRAFRTIIASDSVNLLAAVTLFLLTAGSVQGFAFTLGLTTLVDVFVVALFTHPMMRLISTTRFFGEGHHFSGLSPKLLGAASYKGRGRFERADSIPVGKAKSSAGEAARRQSIAEKKLNRSLSTETDEKKGKN